jgi:hypothetical protein
MRERYTATTAHLARIEEAIRAMRLLIADLGRKREQLAQIEARIAEADRDLGDWRYLERACGRDGIQALELDAMGPSIAETANSLLDAAYGTRFRVEIRTTRMAGRGSKVKQVEDFEAKAQASQTLRETETPAAAVRSASTSSWPSVTPTRAAARRSAMRWRATGAAASSASGTAPSWRMRSSARASSSARSSSAIAAARASRSGAGTPAAPGG